MFWQLYQTLLVFAAVSTLTMLVSRQSIVPLSLLSAALWSVLSLQSRNIEVVGQDPSTTAVFGSAAWQFLALGLAILCLGATMLWFWGVFPPEDDAARPAGREVHSDETGDYNAVNFE